MAPRHGAALNRATVHSIELARQELPGDEHVSMMTENGTSETDQLAARVQELETAQAVQTATQAGTQATQAETLAGAQTAQAAAHGQGGGQGLADHGPLWAAPLLQLSTSSPLSERASSYQYA
jgi:hypothetical protein